MRCGCPQCGIYMVQQEKGLLSGCVCPACLHACNACMGTEQPPMEADELSMQAQLRARLRALEDRYDLE